MFHKFYFSNHVGDFRNKSRAIVVYFPIHPPSSLEVPDKQTNEHKNKDTKRKEAKRKRRTGTKQQTQREANMKTSQHTGKQLQ